MRKAVLWLSTVAALAAPGVVVGLRWNDGRRAAALLGDGLAALDAPVERVAAPEGLDAHAAEAAFARARSLDAGGAAGRRAAGYWHVARTYDDLARGELVLAQAEAQTALRALGQDPRATLAAGLVALRRGDRVRAERLLASVVRDVTAPVAVRTRAGVHHVDVLLDAGRAHEALSLAEALDRGAPGSAPVANRLGLARAAVGDVAGARGAFERAARLDPRAEAPLVNHARLLRGGGDLAGARAMLERALGVAPASAEAWLAYGVVLAELGAPGARHAIIEAARAAPDEPGPLVAQGDLDLREGNFAGAAESYRQALTRAPDDPSARTNLGVALARTGDRRAALAAFEDATRRAPQVGAAWNGLGAMRLALGDVEGAVGPLQHAAVILQDDPNPTLNLGLALERLGRWDDAARAFRETLRRSPGNEVARRHLATLQPGAAPARPVRVASR